MKAFERHYSLLMPKNLPMNLIRKTQRFHKIKEIRVWKNERLFNYELPDERVVNP